MRVCTVLLSRREVLYMVLGCEMAVLYPPTAASTPTQMLTYMVDLASGV